MRKLIASGLAAALALTATPVASAQLSSSSSLFSSSSEAAPQQPDHVQELEDVIEQLLNETGQTRLAEYDRAAESMLRDAYSGKVTWYDVPGATVDDYQMAVYRDLNNGYALFRFPHSSVDEVLFNLGHGSLDLDSYGPYGLAVGSDDHWVYFVIAEPYRI